MEHSMEHNMEPLMEFHSNLPEMLAVDLEQSSNIFQSKQLTAGAPAPGLADDGDGRRYSLPHNPRYLTPLLLSQQDGVLSNSKSLQTIHQKYSDIFAPLDYHTPKRDSVSSSDSSVDLEPRSISTQDESILTVDTWLESDKHTIPILLHISPTSEYASPLSWINLDGDDEGFSPITQRRRSSMTDFPKYMQQFKSSNETSVETMSSSPRKAVASEASTKLVNEAPPSIPQRRSSLQHEGEMGHNARHSIELWQPNEEPVLTFENSAGTSFLEDEADFTFRNSTSTSPQNDSAFVTPNEYTPINPRTSGESIGLVIASSEVSFEEWLESDRKYFPCREELVALRPIPHEVCELLRYIVKTFPEPLLQCDSQLADTVCKLSREVRRYDTSGLESDYPATSRHRPNHQQSKPVWKRRGHSTSAMEQQTQPNTTRIGREHAWRVLSKIFPRGREVECKALYAYLVIYNYITAQYLRELSRPSTSGTTTRPNTSKSSNYPDLDSDVSSLTPPRPSTSETIGIPRKAVRVLGLGEDKSVVPSGAPRPSSRDRANRTSTLTSLRSVASTLLLGMGQGQQRQGDSRGQTASATTFAGHGNSSSRITTSAPGRAGTRPATPTATYKASNDTAELRRGIAMCCARLAITLQRVEQNTMECKLDKDCEADPSFMRLLCKQVQIAEWAIDYSP